MVLLVGWLFWGFVLCWFLLFLFGWFDFFFPNLTAEDFFLFPSSHRSPESPFLLEQVVLPCECLGQWCWRSSPEMEMKSVPIPTKLFSFWRAPFLPSVWFLGNAMAMEHVRLKELLNPHFLISFFLFFPKSHQVALLKMNNVQFLRRASSRFVLYGESLTRNPLFPYPVPNRLFGWEVASEPELGTTRSGSFVGMIWEIVERDWLVDLAGQWGCFVWTDQTRWCFLGNLVNGQPRRPCQNKGWVLQLNSPWQGPLMDRKKGKNQREAIKW